MIQTMISFLSVFKKQAAGLNMESKLALEDWSEDTSEAAVAQRMKELSVKGSGAFAGGDDDDEEEVKTSMRLSVSGF